MWPIIICATLRIHDQCSRAKCARLTTCRLLGINKKTMMTEMVVEAVSRHDDFVIIKMIW